jgi:nitrogen fixation-related uncharacterized protein
MSERGGGFQEPRMGVETDPDAQRRMEISALGWRLQNGAYDDAKSVGEMLADAESTLKRLREREAA